MRGAGPASSLGREQVHDRKAPIGPPALGQLQQLRLAREVIEPVSAPDRAAQRQVTYADDVGAVQGDDQEAAHGP